MIRGTRFIRWQPRYGDIFRPHAPFGSRANGPGASQPLPAALPVDGTGGNRSDGVRRRSRRGGEGRYLSGSPDPTPTASLPLVPAAALRRRAARLRRQRAVRGRLPAANPIRLKWRTNRASANALPAAPSYKSTTHPSLPTRLPLSRPPLPARLFDPYLSSLVSSPLPIVAPLFPPAAA